MDMVERPSIEPRFQLLYTAIAYATTHELMKNWIEPLAAALTLIVLFIMAMYFTN